MSMLRQSLQILRAALMIVLLASYAPIVLAATEPTQPLDLKGWLDMLIKVMLPVIWTSVSPVATAFITSAVKSIAAVHLPQPIQVILSALFGAVMGGLSGNYADALPLGAESAAQIGAGMGATGQMLASVRPATLNIKNEPLSR